MLLTLLLIFYSLLHIDTTHTSRSASTSALGSVDEFDESTAGLQLHNRSRRAGITNENRHSYTKTYTTTNKNTSSETTITITTHTTITPTFTTVTTTTTNVTTYPTIANTADHHQPATTSATTNLWSSDKQITTPRNVPKDYFVINDGHFKLINVGDAGRLEFRTKTKQARVSLTNAPCRHYRFPELTVGFGIDDNTNIKIWRTDTGNVRHEMAKTHYRGHLFDAREWTPLWVEWHKANISAGRQDNPQTTASWTAARTFEIKYIVINSQDAWWEFDRDVKLTKDGRIEPIKCAGLRSNNDTSSRQIDVLVKGNFSYYRAIEEPIAFSVMPGEQQYREFFVRLATTNSHSKPRILIRIGANKGRRCSISKDRILKAEVSCHINWRTGQYQPFWVWYRKGRIVVKTGDRNHLQPIISWSDPDHFHVNFYGLRVARDDAVPFILNNR